MENKYQLFKLALLGVIAVSTSYIALNMGRLLDALHDIASGLVAL